MDTNNSILTTFLLNNLEDTTIDVNRIMYNGSNENYTDFLINNDTTESSVNDFQTSVMNQPKLNKTSRICTTSTSTTTEDPFDEFGPPDGVEYIFVPLGVIIFVIILSAVVLIISRRRKLERLRHRLMPLYDFDPGEEGEDDWETELLDEGFSSRQRRQGYQSIDNEENSELFGH
ncbi:uncharacterized protein C3orf18 homolog isoform X1 [Microplitis mediator]|uniref:uncharacterized protein C3orf18 homolog isoform X1 n=1 Tax=Microplitis mediator TaxID=375433 RepID=UPI0025545F52|nr:uncharacterized protein C3orf18 homolog isoform X1 [Microplitis mediator]